MTRLVDRVVTGTDPTTLRRDVHTVKGNAGFFGLDSLVTLCQGRIGLRARTEGVHLVIQISDDGRGVDWERIREVARRAGLPAEVLADLERALFVDGLSSRTEVSTVSGRGVGMAAVAEASAALGGRIEIRSVAGVGTTTRFVFDRTLSDAA